MSGPINILVTSDTHVTSGARLPDAILLLADRADQVLHGGDCVDVDVLDTLEALAPTTAVAGNCDGADIVSRCGVEASVAIGGVQFAIVHDGGPRTGRHDRLVSRFAGADVVIYGHSHEPEIARTPQGVWVLNPGSPTQRRRAPFHSAIWLVVDDGHVASADLLNLDSPLPDTMSL